MAIESVDLVGVERAGTDFITDERPNFLDSLFNLENTYDSLKLRICFVLGDKVKRRDQVTVSAIFSITTNKVINANICLKKSIL